MMFYKLSFGYFSFGYKLLLVLFIAVNEANSKRLQIRRSSINFQEKIIFFKVSSTLEMTFQILALSRS